MFREFDLTVPQTLQPVEFAEIVGADHVLPASAADLIGGVQPKVIVEPATPSEVARMLALSNERRLSVIPRGGGTKLGWGNAPRSADVVLSLRRLERVLEHAAGDMTATVEAGCTIGAFQDKLAECGQRLALDPLWPKQASVGGVLATADCGPLRSRYGPPRDLVLGVTVALADGTLARSGGKVVKNVAGYDLPKLFTGSFGTLGVITQATFRLHPVPAATRLLSFTLPTDGIGRFMATMRDCSLLTSAVQADAADDGAPSACVLVEGLHEAIASKAERIEQAALAAGATLSDASDEAWLVREQLFEDHGTSFAVARIGLLPTQFDRVVAALQGDVCCPIRWQLVLQATGTALVRMESIDADALVFALSRFRAALADHGGSLVVLRRPPERREAIEVWGAPGDALPLMKGIKSQFDPIGILNPGRFVGGI